MDNPEPQKQLCRITLMFTVDTDDEAIEIKKAVSVVVKDKPDIAVTFTITNAPPVPKR